MPSLSQYDKGKKSFEGRRIQRDIDSSLDAQSRLFAPLLKHNKKANKQRRYSPECVMCVGNHEDRLDRFANDHPETDGFISLKALKFHEHWKVVPFKTTYAKHGIAFSHYFASGLNGQPISGENPAANLVKRTHMSAVQGHSHLYSHYEHTKPDGQKIFGLSVGCYAHKDMVEGWNRNTAHLWWHGVVMLEGVGRWPGYYEEIRAICQQRLLDKYL